MNSKTLKRVSFSLFVLLLFSLVSIVTIWQAFIPLSVSSLRTEHGVIEENGKGLFLHAGDIRQALFKISPFDDYIYHTDGSKVHIFANTHFEDTGTVHTLKDAFSFYIHQLTIPSSTFDWTITGPDGTVRYKATLIKNQVSIERNVLEPKKPITAYGNSMIICTNCFITSGGTAYFTGVYVTNKKVLESLSTAFTPVLTTNALPTTVKDITVRNSRGEAVLLEKTSGNIFYEEPWRLVETKAKTGKQHIILSF